MHNAIRRPILAVAAMTTAGAMALSPAVATPLEISAPVRISTEAVQLTDAWSDLLNDTLISGYLLGQLAVGANSTYPLPNPIFVAPIAAQLVINPLIYTVQILTGQADKVPTEIIAHINNLAVIAGAIAKDVPPAIVQEIQAPFIALSDAIASITTSGNLLLGLFEAPAVFLNGALNSKYGLIGVAGPIALALIVRNVLANGLYTAPPTVVLPFKKPAAAVTSKPAAAKAVSPRGAASSGTASSARSKPKPSANSHRKTSTAKTGNDKAGQGRSNRPQGETR